MIRLRLLLLALLPGLLLSSGSSVRVCLHALVGAGADCADCRPDASSCCGGAESDEPVAISEGERGSCCLHLEGSPETIAAKERAAASDAHGLVLLAPAAPIALAISHIAAPSARARLVAPRARSVPCARGILPLRI